MIQLWVKRPGGKVEWNGVIQGTKHEEYQNWMRCATNAATHRMRVEWGNHQPPGTTDPKLSMPMVRVFPEEVPLVELQKLTDDFKRLGADSLKWLVARHNLKLVQPRQPGPGDGKAQEAEMARVALREFWITDAGRAHGQKPNVKEIPAAQEDSGGDGDGDPVSGPAKMSDGQLEEGIATSGGDVPRDWARMDRKGKEAAYKKAIGKGGVVAGASK